MAPRGPKMDPKIDPKWSQNCSWGSPGTLPGQLSPNFESQGHFWIHFGTPKEPQNRLKMRLSGKMVVPGLSFSRFLLGRVLQLTFSPIFCCFFAKKSMYFSIVFSSRPCIFFDMATFTKHCKIHIETHFFIFCFFVFSLEKCF